MNKGRHHLLPAYKQTHDKRDTAESLHAYICKVRVIVCDFVFFLEKYQLSKMRPPPSLHEKPLKFIARGHIFRKLWNVAALCHYTPLLWSFTMPCCLDSVTFCVCKKMLALGIGLTVQEGGQ